MQRQISKGRVKNIKHPDAKSYIAFKRRKGNKRIAPINLNTTSRVNPTILKGRRINQIKGNRNISIRASGQQSTNKINQRRIAISVLIESLCAFYIQTSYQSPIRPNLRKFWHHRIYSFAKMYREVIKNVQQGYDVPLKGARVWVV